MPSFTKDKAGKLKLTGQTENPDQATEQAKQLAKAQPAPTVETEKK